ncbi:MAG: GGDEF domain-containing protein, partial [Alphaproteobacteria bacterium]|nr:GGDEF domain-containing protein [Alphaproteobacteria bacterium]
LIRKALRETDLPARLGGEEFGVILPETQAEGAFWVAERIRAAIARHLVEYKDEAGNAIPLGCTVSIGVAGAGYDHQGTAESLYKAADTRLYIAKNTGRNQVSVDEIVQLH